MLVTAYFTPIISTNDQLEDVIVAAIPQLPEESILVVASKVVSTVENRFVPKTTEDKSEKWELVKREADYFTDPHSSKYNLMLTIKDNWMFVNAGIDESNADNQYILWPENPNQSAERIWHFLRKHYGVSKVGVTISDSSSFPLNWGVIGRAIAYCGFHPLKSYIGKPDLFGRTMKMEQVNIMQSVTAAAVLEMGEGDEATPLAVVQNIRDVVWQDRVPTAEERQSLSIELEDDAYAPILTKADWQKGGSGKQALGTKSEGKR